MTAPLSPPPPDASRRARTTGGLLLLVMFAAGLVAGLAWGMTRARRVEAYNTIDVQIRAEMPEELSRLGLTPGQSQRVTEILTAGRLRADSVMADLGPRLRLVFDSVDAGVRAVLTPEQRTRLDQARKGRALRIIQESTVVNGKASGRTDTLRAP